MGDIPPWLGDKLWPASRFLGSGRIFFSLHYYVSWTDVIHQFLPLVPAIKIATNRYRPARHEAEAFHSDPEIRGRFLPSFIHNHPNPALSKSSRALARFRETAFMQKTLNICQTFIGSFFGVALVCVMARSQPFLTRRAPVIVGRLDTHLRSVLK